MTHTSSRSRRSPRMTTPTIIPTIVIVLKKPAGADDSVGVSEGEGVSVGEGVVVGEGDGKSKNKIIIITVMV